MRRVTIRGLLARKVRLALTATAIVLGVTFVTGTLILGDTLNRTFDNLVGTVYRHVSFEIRGKASLNGVGDTGVDSTVDRRPIPAWIAPAVRRLPGVAFAYGSVEGYAQFVARDGNAIGAGGTSTPGFSFDPNRELSSLRLVEGKAPTSSHDVVMDKATAAKYHFAIGDRVRVLLPAAPQRFTVTGIVKFGNDNNLAGDTLAGFNLATAQDLFKSRGSYDTINVLAAPGANNVRLQRAIAKILPPDVQVVSGTTVANELSQTINNDLSFLSTALLIFAFVSLFVGGFTIFNTFSITVGQRTRELALLRVVGASHRQVFGSVLAEAAVMGLLASAVGLGLGVLAAAGLRALLKAFGIVLPSAPLVFEARTAAVAITVGVGVSIVSALIPARRALRIPPVAALAEPGEGQGRTLRRWRVIAGSATAGAGAAALVAGLTGPTLGLVALGALAVFVAAGMLVPIVARPLSSALGRPLASVLGVSGRLGRENSMRNPGRTAQAAGALMIGLALVSAIAVLGASLSQSAKHNVESALRADYVIGGSDSISTSVAPAVSRLPGVKATTLVYKGQFDLEGSPSSLDAATTAGLNETVNLHTVAGRGTTAMAAGQLLVDTTTAAADHLHVGSVVPVTFAQTGRTTMRIGGIYEYNPLVGSFITGARYFVSHFDHPLVDAVLVSTAPAAAHFARTLNRALGGYPNLNIQSRAQFESSEQASVNRLLGLVYVLLALAVVIALIGIVNTLMLSVFERTREIGLLRAVGMRRRQVAAMIRSESVIIAVFGALVGMTIGTGLGIALASSLRNDGVTTIAVPVSSLLAFLLLSGLLGLFAATWPARRAAHLDVLAAVAAR